MPDPADAQNTFGRFLLVGATNAAISYVVFRLLLWLLAGSAGRATIAQAAAYAAGTGWSYYWNSRWAFSSAPRRRFTRFFAVQLACLASSSLALGVLIDWAGLPPTLSWLAVMTVITVVNYVALRSWAFARTSNAR